MVTAGFGLKFLSIYQWPPGLHREAQEHFVVAKNCTAWPLLTCSCSLFLFAVTKTVLTTLNRRSLYCLYYIKGLFNLIQGGISTGKYNTQMNASSFGAFPNDCLGLGDRLTQVITGLRFCCILCYSCLASFLILAQYLVLL